jgi:hypothetical protein
MKSDELILHEMGNNSNHASAARLRAAFMAAARGSVGGRLADFVARHESEREPSKNVDPGAATSGFCSRAHHTPPK